MVSRRTDAVIEPPKGPLAEAVRRLVELFQPERIYLFGSQARGDTTEDSDYDLMVIVPASNEPEYRRAQEAYGVLWGVRIPMDVLVWTHDEFEEMVPVVASLPATIMREGKLLYAA
jgi:uncharacterized protein